jgi:hypothetical protein
LTIVDLRLVICDWQLSIGDCRLSAEEATMPLLQSAIGNRKSSVTTGWLYND